MFAKAGRPGILVSACDDSHTGTKISMALHRDIYWVGRQWAVTGYGVQACDQKQKGKFDIEASRLWEDGLLESLRSEAWLNVEDFDKALAIARERCRELPPEALPPEESVARLNDRDPMEQPKPAGQKFDLRVQGWPAKFVPMWRVQIRRVAAPVVVAKDK